MQVVKHKLCDHQINPLTETLVIGTFNPDAGGNIADFFYGRSHNFLWRLLPFVYGESDLKGKGKDEKLLFMERRRIDFIDLISEVTVDSGQELNYADNYIDSRVSRWTDVIQEIDKLHNLKRVCFTRKTFSGIPEIKLQITQVEEHCKKRNLPFAYLKTPARGYGPEKQKIWNNFFHDDSRLSI